MVNYLIRRIIGAFGTLLLISFISFALIVLPPGDVLTSHITQLTQISGEVSPEVMRHVEALREQYGLDQPVYVQYAKWMRGILTRGDFGWSFSTLRNVSDFIWGLMGNTLILIVASLLFIYSVALPIGFYSAVRQYSPGDYFFTFLGFLGLAVPNFLFALVLLFLSYLLTGRIISGMYSPEMIDAPWSFAKFGDMLQRIWIPTLVIGSSGTASAIRILRSNLLDELHKPYVQMARAKGLDEWWLLIKYPLRIAINPLLSTIGFLLPDLFGATIIVSVVLSLPAIGPIYLSSLLNQDMYLAGTIVLLIAAATIIGTLISDILLAIADPRIKLG